MSVHDEVKLCQENNNFCKMVLFIVKGIKGVREMKKNSTGVPADLDPPKFGPPGPNSLADLDPPVQIR